VCCLWAASLAAQQANQLDASRPLFAVLAAINAAGYDADLNAPSNHPLRAAVRAELASRAPRSTARLKRFFAEHKLGDANAELGQYISFALCLDEPPAFEFRYRQPELPPEVRRLIGFEELLSEWWQEADGESLWRRSQPAYEQAIARYHAPVVQAVLDANLYLRNPTSGYLGRRFQIYLDLLGAPNQVHSRSFVDDYFLVITASAQPRIEEIRRGYLHYLLDPLAIKHAALLEKKRPIGDLAGAAPLLADVYKEDFVLLAGMCLVKAVESRMSPPAARRALVGQAMSEGFILTAYFAESLAAYEKGEQAMRFFLPEMIEGIDLAKEDKRIAQVEFTGKRQERIVPAAPPPPPPPKSEAEQAVDAAESLYEQRELAGARAAFLKFLAAPGPKPLQARAHYGLARIAALQKDPETSEQLFARALELDPEPAVKAWCHVYLGRLSLAASEPAMARRHFDQALTVTGASDRALEAAREGLRAAAAKIQN
jgi:tetratricopeptide (TPR) repeat protein